LDVLLSDDATKCAEALQRLVKLQREEGSGSQLASSLAYYLPSSAYHHLLCTLPQPDQTNPNTTTTLDAELAIHLHSLSLTEEVITLTEEHERNAVEREVEKRRTRLDSAGKSRDVLRNEIGAEVWRSSKVSDALTA
jgi:superkiller protein 3